MTRTLILIVMSLGLLGTAPGHAQFTPQGGGGHHGGGPWGGGDREAMRAGIETLAILNLEGMWAVLSFGVALPSDQLSTLRAPFQENWDRRASILADTRQDSEESWNAIGDEFKPMRKQLDAVIKSTIGDEKFRDYSKILKEREKAARNRMGGGPGGGPPPGH